jgi:hypothetical protein
VPIAASYLVALGPGSPSSGPTHRSWRTSQSPLHAVAVLAVAALCSLTDSEGGASPSRPRQRIGAAFCLGADALSIVARLT